ncbi:hypothetical protein BC829DRAFT_266170 [Chytridium lagenaria]|nr:hypothetical protein BC829DRAFT_266170 [Chytridium lagenaria]
MNSLSSLLRGDNDGDSAGSLLAGLDVSRLDLATTESLITLLASTSTSASSSPLSNLQHTSQPPTSASHTSSFLTEGFSVSGSLPSILQQPVSQKLPSAPTIPGDRITEKTRFNLACARCRTKKRKCDGVRPACSNCVKAQARGGETAMCYYEESVKRKARKAGPRTDALLDKLNALESLLRPLQVWIFNCFLFPESPII